MLANLAGSTGESPITEPGLAFRSTMRRGTIEELVLPIFGDGANSIVILMRWVAAQADHGRVSTPEMSKQPDVAGERRQAA